MPATEYSHSRLSAFENCPRQFEYRYVKRIPRDTETVEAFVGKRVHEILERLYHHVARHGNPPSLRQVIDRYQRDWTLHWHAKVEIIREDRDLDAYKAQGQRCLENYYRAQYPFDDGETIGIEHPVSIRLDDEGAYRARGIIDRLVRKGPGRYEIHDYKTGGFMPGPEKLAQDRQLALYQIGIEQSVSGIEEVDLIWHFLTFGKTIRQTREPEALEDLRLDTIQRIDAIERCPSFAPRPGALCRWCEYRDICPDALLGPSASPHDASSGAERPSPEVARSPIPRIGPPSGEQLSLL